MQTRLILIALAIHISPIVAVCATTDSPNHTNALNDTSWVLSTLHGQPVLTDRQVTMHFEDGRIQGSDGCNNYTTTYMTSEKSIKISQSITTKKIRARPPGVMEQEAQYLKALTTAATYRRDGDRLELRTADDALALTLSAEGKPQDQ